MNEILQQLGQIKIIPVIALDEAETAVPLGKALLDGGLPCAEITQGAAIKSKLRRARRTRSFLNYFLCALRALRGKIL